VTTLPLNSFRKNWAIWSILLFGAGALSSITHGLITNDESWFLQVVHRMAGGELLYRDIFFGITPLSAYLTYLPVRILGAQILIIKFLLAACFAISGLLAFILSEQLSLNRSFPNYLGLGMIAFSSPWLTGTSAPYTPLAVLFMMACLVAMLAWSSRKRDAQPSSAILTIASLLAGLGFATKQTTGTFTYLALVASVCYIDLSQKKAARIVTKDLLLVAGTGLLVIGVIVLAPVLLSQSLAPFLDYTFLNKKTYIDVAGIPYTADIQRALQSFFTDPTLESLRWLIWQSNLTFPVITLFFWLLGMLRGKAHQGQGILLGIFSLFAFLDIFPRVTAHHASCLLPLMAVTSAWGWQAGGIGHAKKRGPTTKSWIYRSLIIIGCFSFLIPSFSILREDYQISRLPHFKGIVVREETNDIKTSLRELDQSVNDQPIFFLTANASLLYLVSGFKNPTPYDYPLVTAFGLHGEEQTIAAIEAGRIEFVCYYPLPLRYPLRPQQLSEYVEDRMEFIQDIGICQLYKRQVSQAHEQENSRQVGGRYLGSDPAPQYLIRKWALVKDLEQDSIR
jgi:hypothetical protein